MLSRINSYFHPSKQVKYFFWFLSLGLLTQLTLQAECRNDTIYSSTIEFGTVYPDGRIINQYNGQNKLIESIEQKWESTTKIYKNDLRSTYSYNPNGKLIETLIEVWTVNAWKNYAKEFYTLDANGNVTEFLSQNWLNKWEDRTKIQTTFNSFNQQTSSTISSWNYFGNSTWDKRSKDSMLYNTNQKLSEHFTYLFDESINKWEPISLYKFKYSSNNLVVSLLELDWYLNQWDSMSLVTYTYNANQLATLELNERWDETYGKYIASRSTYQYTSSNKLSQKLIEEWDPNNKIWLNYYKESYVYDGNENLISKSKYLDWDDVQKQFNLETKEIFICTQLLSINSPNNHVTKLFPNPVNSTIHIESKFQINKIEIYHINGSLLLAREGFTNLNEPLDLGTLNNGIYFIKCYFNNGIEIQPFNIQH